MKIIKVKFYKVIILVIKKFQNEINELTNSKIIY